ncbi:sarcosine oxidase subunit gamma [Aestuariibius insulae]|uniref:sarcosine oxidase subunit gamma n=1 Tax=Aestuariibius insulae TaxID=2058287 RepID=UPI00345F0512
MSDHRTALGGCQASGLVEISEAEARGMIAIRADLDNADLKRSLDAVVGAGVPAPGQVSDRARGQICWMSPDELLLMLPKAACDETLTRLRDDLVGQHALVEDMSDARAVFVLEGDHCRDVLAKISPADVRASVLSPGVIRRTRMGQVPAAFWLTREARAEVICFRSVARYVFDLLDAASSGPPLRMERPAAK